MVYAWTRSLIPSMIAHSIIDIRPIGALTWVAIGMVVVAIVIEAMDRQRTLALAEAGERVHATR